MKNLFRDDKAQALKASLLADLIVIAGGSARLALLCGIKKSTVYGWITRLEISPRGAVLVEKSKELKHFFSASKLRPDTTDVAFAETRKGDVYTKARRCQKAYEATPEFKLMSPSRAIKQHAKK